MNWNLFLNIILNGILNVSDVREIYIVLLYLICIKLCGFCLCIIVFYWLLNCSYIVRYVFNRLKKMLVVNIFVF